MKQEEDRHPSEKDLANETTIIFQTTTIQKMSLKQENKDKKNSTKVLWLL